MVYSKTLFSLQSPVVKFCLVQGLKTNSQESLNFSVLFNIFSLRFCVL